MAAGYELTFQDANPARLYLGFWSEQEAQLKETNSRDLQLQRVKVRTLNRVLFGDQVSGIKLIPSFLSKPHSDFFPCIIPLCDHDPLARAQGIYMETPFHASGKGMPHMIGMSPHSKGSNKQLYYLGDPGTITRIFNLFIALTLVSLVAGSVILFSHGDDVEALLTAATLLPVLACSFLIRRKAYEWVARLLAILMILMITVLSTRGLGIHALSNLGYPAILIVASLVTKKRTMIFLTALTVACLAWLVFGELYGAFTPTVLVRSVPGDFFSVALTIIATAIMARSISDALARSNQRSLQELKERQLAEEKYRNIFEKSIGGIFQSTPEGRFLHVNPAMARMYGFASPEEMIQKVTEIPTQLYVDPEARNTLDKRLTEAGAVSGFESLERRKDGSEFWTSTSLRMVREGEGNIHFYEGTVEDISLRKKVEQERESLIKELALKNEELERFTYTVSHDLKSPLITINGFLGYLVDDSLSSNQERLKVDIKRINEAVGKMHRLLNELLELSRIGRLMNPPETVPFAELAGSALELVHGQLMAHHVRTVVQPDLPLVTGDRQRLTEVLQNLVDNAVKFMGDQPDPCIEIGQQGEEKGLPVFFVRDNGIGIPEEFHQRVFGLFDKLNPRSEGTGVGLAIVKRIVETHGGRIWLESDPGHGSTFFFTLLKDSAGSIGTPEDE